jgi:hypothetical protein
MGITAQQAVIAIEMSGAASGNGTAIPLPQSAYPLITEARDARFQNSS